jgi:hypothetical protein
MTAVEFTRKVGPMYFLVRGRKANNDWTKQLPLYLTSQFDLHKHGIPGGRADSIYARLVDLPPGDSLIVEL